MGFISSDTLWTRASDGTNHIQLTYNLSQSNGTCTIGKLCLSAFQLCASFLHGASPFCFKHTPLRPNVSIFRQQHYIQTYTVPDLSDIHTYIYAPYNLDFDLYGPELTFELRPLLRWSPSLAGLTHRYSRQTPLSHNSHPHTLRRKTVLNILHGHL